jgi:DNA-binding MarR family transcriptional regulator
MYEDRILRALRQITRQTDLHSRKLVHDWKLTLPQLVCLRQLSQDGETTASALSRQVSLSQATVTGILDRLEARKLLTRERSAGDRRRNILKLTAAGRKLVAEAPGPLQEHFAHRLAEMDVAGRDQVALTLENLVTLMAGDELDGGLDAE